MRSRLLRGLGATLIGRSINVLARVLLPPLFLRAWGVNIYGEWLILSSLAAWISMADFGSQTYIVNRLTQLHAKRDIPGFRRMLHSGMATYLAIGGIALVVAIFVLPFLRFEGVLKIALTTHPTVVIVLLILVLQLLFSMPQALLLGVYRASERLPRGVMLANLSTILQVVLMGIPLYLKLSMIWVAGGAAVSVLIVAGIAFYDGNRIWPHYQIGSLRHATMATFHDFVNPSFHFLIIQIAQTISLQGIIILTSWLFSPVEVVVVASMRTMTNVSQQILGMVTFVAWPEFTRLDKRGEEDQLMNLFRLVLLTLVAISGGIGLIYRTFGKQIFVWWLGGYVNYDVKLMSLFITLMIMTTFWMGYRNLLMSVNHHKRISWALVFGALLEIVLAMLGGKLWGPVGMAGGMVVASMALPLWYIPLEAVRKWKPLGMQSSFWGLIVLLVSVEISVKIQYGFPVMLAIIFGWWLVGAIRYFRRLGRETYGV